MKSVNHRYLDVNIKMPKALNFFESTIRNLLKEYMERGKVDLYITFEDFSEDNFCLKYNEELAGEYLKHLTAMADKFGLDNDIKVSTLSNESYFKKIHEICRNKIHITIWKKKVL